MKKATGWGVFCIFLFLGCVMCAYDAYKEHKKVSDYIVIGIGSLAVGILLIYLGNKAKKRQQN